METIHCEAFEYDVTVRLNGNERHRFRFAASKEEAIREVTDAFIVAEGYRQEVVSATFTGRVIKDGIIR